jgi:glycosyltransferase involved in cell wall biosynthesis
MKTAIFFDSFVHGGGAEKLVLKLANLLDADVYTSGYNPLLYKEWIGKARIINIGNLTVKKFPRIGFVESALRFGFFKPKQKYDLYIFSGFFSIFAARNCKPNLWYCCQPNRTIYDLKEYQKNKTNFFGKFLIEAYSFFLKPLDQWIVKKHIQKIICISLTVGQRIKKYYGLYSGVIYPPVDAKKYFFRKFEDFYFFAARLIPEKRVELLLETFSELPEKKLVIAGSGPLEEKVRDYSRKFPNIVFVGRASEQQMLGFFADCFATIYLPVQEDFGMFPLEGNASGKACIAAKEGCLLETIAQGKNGFLVEAKKEELKKAILSFDLTKAKKMKADCEKKALLFDNNIFEKKWKEVLKG